ncbi:hypothetical protein NECAME_00887 [Necator americanus]|uniref:Golgin subfamily A member 7/ERF4 domain-containing protein n=1 Tax=Necator americanus TaxID=51031 RepID=W2SNT6_NECAM|nr:hypothetical protein NECAME_00887 [Necator americanus]ETN71198.1 hypothetical protein NECAME_00887 [Necator americanus]
MSRRSRVSDEIDVISSSDDEMPLPPSKPPITIRGVGHITMFGLNSRFDTDFPSELIGRVAPEELSDTLGRINSVLKRHVQMSRWAYGFVVGGCCAVCCFVAVRLDARCSLLYALIEGRVDLFVIWDSSICQCCETDCVFFKIFKKLSRRPSYLLVNLFENDTVTAVEKTLDHENICLYHKLGLHWRLVKRPVEGSRLTEYVLELQTLPKVQLMLPD